MVAVILLFSCSYLANPNCLQGETMFLKSELQSFRSQVSRFITSLLLTSGWLIYVADSTLSQKVAAICRWINCLLAVLETVPIITAQFMIG